MLLRAVKLLFIRLLPIILYLLKGVQRCKFNEQFADGALSYLWQTTL